MPRLRTTWYLLFRQSLSPKSIAQLQNRESFKACTSKAGKLSRYSNPFLVTIDTTAPTVTLTNEYDSRGQLVRSIQGDGTSLERSSLVHYDELGRVTESRDFAGNWTGQEYDAVGQVTGSVDADGETTGNVYDLGGRVIASRNQLGAETTQEYDNRGRVTVSVDALGNRTTSTYVSVRRRAV